MIYLARHGETTWNHEGRYQGRRESPLSERGCAQAEALARAFTSERRSQEPVPARIVTSPLARCRLTAAPLAAALGIEVELDERLIEIGHGDWEGLLRSEIEARDAERYRRWRVHPTQVEFTDGESVAQVASRWKSFAAELVTRDEVTLLVTHDAVVRVALLEIQHLPLENFWQVAFENAAYAVIARGSDGLLVREPLNVAHLRDLRVATLDQAL